MPSDEYTMVRRPDVDCDVCERWSAPVFIISVFGKAQLVICDLCVAALDEARQGAVDA